MESVKRKELIIEYLKEYFKNSSEKDKIDWQPTLESLEVIQTITFCRFFFEYGFYIDEYVKEEREEDKCIYLVEFVLKIKKIWINF
ncbi:hypothetical protein DICPUDRAFT_157101 [Dictyostelium purpureum]|uniref:Uncharacterized protein n=1 Tax=Dictyostelium purpureum TaxID=5786 RepID=F0ZY95_DICPU|nr:uncharacterized protein DICPUDRAFT_157101 [Dictyostelium purpureum]EGC31089.1 hypothetical protein DICPUDRAFT_157101 [Dictyostelium purpureum]|eukprot:XP_003292390.1 hypothetical protein DICPUDRAFT_157101 [Dictyostelium purpureum]